MSHFLVTEVHNFGGFFGGDTVSLSGRPWREHGEEATLTIDEAALANVANRHHIAAGMLLDLELAGERVERATLLGAASYAELRAALSQKPSAELLPQPTALAHRCAACQLWVPSTPIPDGLGACPICHTPIAARGA